MSNLTNTQSNNTQVPAQTIISMEAKMLLIFTPVMISFVCFLYIIVVMLNVYFTSPHIRENARYMLFAHMLINDTMYLTIAVSLYLFSLFQVSFPVLVCYFILIMSSSAFKVTPYNLAAMSLERYIAICFPLRHAEFCTRQRTGNVIALIWTIGLTPHVVDLIILASSVKTSFFSQHVSCSRVSFLNTEIQSILRSFMHAFSFSLVGLVIIFTYVKIMLVAKNIGSRKDSASKASRTVMLHAFQLLLCLTAFTYPITETYLKGYIIMLPVLNFCLFMCLPRFLSPLIYGIRDDTFRVCLRRYVFCRSVKIHVVKFTY
uniref:G-protein coupled receptors family 1 profile domain-containing protein n=1 Tax=Leptobrachium leishanense TaxID=445787 RepID=A0A8C5LY50_9ANUR